MARRKFTPDQKHRIIYRYHKGDLVKTIAHDFGTTTATVCSIVHRAGERRRIGERRLVVEPVPARLRAWRCRHRKLTKRYEKAWREQPRHE